jgi:oxygen-independent coproporphyrinogen-3 oxidase
MKPRKAGLYIHVPFCISKCGYCSFYSIKSLNLIPQYIEALKFEMEYYKGQFSSFDTIYFGGGTPSLLTTLQLAEILAVIRKYFRIDANSEITLEANAGDISLEYLKALRGTGINRLNIGIQSFDDKVLKFLGRRHTAKEAVSSIEAARKAGFDNLGIDLIYGIHGAGIKSWKKDLLKALSFAPEHISCYQLSLGINTPLDKQYSAQGWDLPDENMEHRFFLVTDEELKKAGYLHYEVSNFARSDKFKSRHNQKYWKHVPYLGLGPAAHSFLTNRRWWNKASAGTYIREISAGILPVEGTETLTNEQMQLEALFLGLRTSEGIDLRLYKTRYGEDLLTGKTDIIDELIKNKLVVLKNGFLRPTVAGMAVADSLALI